MADPTTSGTSTSEFKLTIVAFIIGSLLETVAGVMHSLQDAGQGASWFPMVYAVLGALTQIAGLFGYTKSRTLVKAAVAAQDAPVATNPKSP